MKLARLVEQIHWIDENLRQEAGKSVNRLLTMRNWLIGYYIVEYEQNGEDRAIYGDRLLQKLAAELTAANKKGMGASELSRYRQFFNTYPQIGRYVQSLLPGGEAILGTMSQKLKSASMGENENLAPEAEKAKQDVILGTTSQKFEQSLIPTEKLINSLSFSHFVELIKISDPRKRLFYEIECIKGTWSVRELKRQINSLYYERAGLSASPEKLSELTQDKIPPEPANHLIKNIYAFEFLGINAPQTIEETDLETALLDHLREFILELGNGFCLEARQKRILIGDEYFFIDLVFYHRILKCHVLIELKVEAFTHANAGQLNTYLNYYKQEVKTEDDNDPIGILLVTNKNESLVQYATAGMDHNLFVSKYLLQLPSIEKLQDFINKELKSL